MGKYISDDMCQKVVTLSVGQLEDIIVNIVDRAVTEALANAVKRDDTIKGGARISGYLGICESKFNQMKPKLEKAKAIWYIGRCLYGSKSRLDEYRDQYLCEQ